jgi:hypothetical protein
MGVWAAATNITRNGANPNYMFRVSAVDVLVDRALIKHAMTSIRLEDAGPDAGQQWLGRIQPRWPDRGGGSRRHQAGGRGEIRRQGCGYDAAVAAAA